MSFWVSSAKQLGLVDTGDGIRFEGEMVKEQQQQQQQQHQEHAFAANVQVHS